VTRHVHDETGPHRGLGLLKVDFPAVETGGCGDDDACPAECESHVRMEVYLFEQVRTRQILHCGLKDVGLGMEVHVPASERRHRRS
jgi:hypothetical protein